MKKVLAMVLIGVLMFGTVSFAAPKGPKDKVHDISDKVSVSFEEIDGTKDQTQVVVTIQKMGSKLEELILTKEKIENQSDLAINFTEEITDMTYDWEMGKWTDSNVKDPDHYWGVVEYDEIEAIYTVTLHFNGDNVEAIGVHALFSAGNSSVTFECDKSFDVEYQ